MAVACRLPRRSARRNAVSLQSGFSETLSNEGGGGGRIKPNPQHQLSIKPGKFTATASPSDTVNTRSDGRWGPDPAFPLHALAGKGSSIPRVLAPRQRETLWALHYLPPHKVQGNVGDAAAGIAPQSHPAPGTRAVGTGKGWGERWRPGRRNAPAASTGWERCREPGGLG